MAKASNLEGKLISVKKINAEMLLQGERSPIWRASSFLNRKSIQRCCSKGRGLQSGGQALFCIENQYRDATPKGGVSNLEGKLSFLQNVNTELLYE